MAFETIRGMRRVLPTLALVAAALGLTPLAGAALAREHGGWVQVDDREHGRGAPAWARGSERGGGERGGGERGAGERGGERGPPAGWVRPGGRPQGPAPEAYYAPPPGAYAPRHGYGMRRGGFLPPEVRGMYVPDPGRYHLRPPPRGYTWVRVGNAFLMMNLATGQIFDVAPD
ncbi:MAG: hypothetical protein E7812_17350 [Phenylobacterium sp.]|nr:MAG: hypothetical protein E7812_17350 [Phenylobacterium sp.]